MKGFHLGKRGLVVGLGLLLGSAFVAPVLASSAGATSEGSGNGSIEICKTLLNSTPAVPGVIMNPTFTFQIDGGGAYTVIAGGCSGMIPVSNGTHTVTETSGSWYSITNISADAGFPALSSATTATSAALVVNNDVAEVRFTNTIDPGYIKVCKNVNSNSTLTGTFNFTVSGPDGFSGTTSAVAGACSQPLEVPAANSMTPVTVKEAYNNLYVTGIVASVNDLGGSVALGTPNFITGTIVVTVPAAANNSTQTDINYTNDVVNFKVCKSWSNDNGAETLLAGKTTTLFPFTETASGVAGPNTAPGPFSLEATQPGNTEICSNPVPYRAGTVVTVQENIIPGSKVEAVTPTGDYSDNSVGQGVSLIDGAGSITLTVGTPITASTGDTGEAVATFTNEYANPGTLELCKNAGTPAPVGSTFLFSVTGVPLPVSVPVGGCQIVGGYLTPVLFPYNSTITVAETASSGNTTSAISVVPTYVNEVVGTTPTWTTETSLSGSPILGASSSVNVVIGEGTITEATFTDVASSSTGPTGPTGTTGTTGATGTSGTTGTIGTSAPAGAAGASSPGAAAPVVTAVVVPTVVPVVTVANPGSPNTGTTSAVTPAAAITAAVAVGSTTKELTGAQRKAELNKDTKALVEVRAAIARVTSQLKTAQGKAHAAAEKHLKALTATARLLSKEIHLLK